MVAAGPAEGTGKRLAHAIASGAATVQNLAMAFNRVRAVAGAVPGGEAERNARSAEFLGHLEQLKYDVSELSNIARECHRSLEDSTSARARAFVHESARVSQEEEESLSRIEGAVRRARAQVGAAAAKVRSSNRAKTKAEARAAESILRAEQSAADAEKARALCEQAESDADRASAVAAARVRRDSESLDHHVARKLTTIRRLERKIGRLDAEAVRMEAVARMVAARAANVALTARRHRPIDRRQAVSQNGRD